MNSKRRYIVIFILLSSCLNDKVTQHKEGKNIGIPSQVIQSDTIQISLGKVKNAMSWLYLIDNKRDNSLILQTRRGKHILSISGYGNSEIVLTNDGKAVIDTVNFGNDGVDEYIISSLIRGSTYGASLQYLVYLNDDWEIFRIPFDRSVVRYEKEINDYRIVSYDGNGDSSLFSFKNGILTSLSEPAKNR